MKKLYIVHGWDGNPDEPALKWLREKLQATRDWEVVALAMPNAENPRIKPWLKTMNENIVLSDNVFLFGHRVGGNAVLRYLDQLSEGRHVAGVVLLAPWLKLDEETIKEEGEEVVEIARPWEEEPIDFENVKIKANSFVGIFSDNDPYVPLSNADTLTEKLGATCFIEKGQFHFDYGSGIVKVPKAFEVIKSL